MKYKRFFHFAKIIVGLFYAFASVVGIYNYINNLSNSSFTQVLVIVTISIFAYTLIKNGLCENQNHKFERMYLMLEIVIGIILSISFLFAFFYAKDLTDILKIFSIIIIPVTFQILFIVRSISIYKNLKYYLSINEDKNIKAPIDNKNTEKDNVISESSINNIIEDGWYDEIKNILENFVNQIKLKYPNITEQKFFETIKKVLETKNLAITEDQSRKIFFASENNVSNSNSTNSEKKLYTKPQKHSNNYNKTRISIFLKKYNKTVVLIIIIALLVSNFTYLIYRSSVINSKISQRTNEYKNKIIGMEKTQEFLKGKISQIDQNSKRKQMEYELYELQQSIDKLEQELEEREYYEWYE